MVVCVKSGLMVKKGLVYVISDVHKCVCGVVSLGIVGVGNFPGCVGTKCWCLREVSATDKYTDSALFRPIQSSSVSAKLATELLESIVEERPEHVNEPEPA